MQHDRGILNAHFSDRRQFLRQLGLGVAAWSSSAGGLTAQSTPPRRRFDLHHHYGSPAWIKRLADSKRQGWQVFQTYSPARSIEAMDKAGVAMSFLSCTTPGLTFGDDYSKEREQARALARDMNDYGAKLVTGYKGRYGLFAALPLPDIDASLREIEYALDTLHADGVGLVSSYGDRWLGDPSFQPVFDELNRRNAIVFVHPTDATCCHDVMRGVNPSVIEWNTDTSRSIYSMIDDGAAASPAVSPATRYANIRFIWSHAGGTLTALSGRFLGGPNSGNVLSRRPQLNSRLYHLRRFYYDTAQSTNIVLLQSLKALVGPSQIVFGSDYPFSTIADHAAALELCGFTEKELVDIARGNALRILPKYRS
jgi:6-methylsalicylate decarboxylase